MAILPSFPRVAQLYIIAENERRRGQLPVIVGQKMKTTGLNLLISDKPDVERESVAESFARHGGAVHRIARFWEPPVFDASSVRVYGADSFYLVLQQKLGFMLCSPDDELLLRVPSAFLKRQITRQTLGQIAAITFPAFVKPVVPKQFRGAVYQSSVELSRECRGLSTETVVFVSESVTFTAEARTFVRDGEVLDFGLRGRGEGSRRGAIRRGFDAGNVAPADCCRRRRVHRRLRMGRDRI
jgi:hypothetical protein